jgi:hypothetical protein
VTVLSVFELARHYIIDRSWSKHRDVVIAYRDVWSSYLGQSILSGISLNAPYLAFFHSVNHELVASYLLADRLARTPIALLSISVRSHLTHNYSDLVSNDRHSEGDAFMTSWSVRLAAVGLFGLLILGFGIKLFGDHYSSARWANAGLAVMVLTPWAASTLSNSPAKAALTALRKNAYVLNVQAAELVCRLLIIAALLPHTADHFFLCLFCIHLPGIVLNTALYLRAGRAWKLVAV